MKRGKSERERREKEGRGRGHLLCSLFQLLNIQFTDFVVVVDSIYRVTEYLVQEGKGNDLTDR